MGEPIGYTRFSLDSAAGREPAPETFPTILNVFTLPMNKIVGTFPGSLRPSGTTTEDFSGLGSK